MATETENLATAEAWQEAWNEDVERMVDEIYAPDAELHDVIRGNSFRGREEIRAVERQLLAFDPSRRLEIFRKFASGDEIALEYDVHWQNGSHVVQGVTLLTFSPEGQIVLDRTYTGDPGGVVSGAVDRL